MADNTYEEVRGFVMCDQNQIENEFHFILKSKLHDELKINFIVPKPNVYKYMQVENTKELNDSDKFIVIMSKAAVHSYHDL